MRCRKSVANTNYRGEPVPYQNYVSAAVAAAMLEHLENKLMDLKRTRNKSFEVKHTFVNGNFLIALILQTDRPSVKIATKILASALGDKVAKRALKIIAEAEPELFKGAEKQDIKFTIGKVLSNEAVITAYMKPGKNVEDFESALESVAVTKRSSVEDGKMIP